jgi:hypothetical protein
VEIQYSLLYAHNILGLDAWPMVGETILIEPLDKHLSDDFYARVQATRLDVREDGRAFGASLHGGAGTPWSSDNSNLRAEGDLVCAERVERLLGVDNENAVVDIDTEKQLSHVSMLNVFVNLLQ